MPVPSDDDEDDVGSLFGSFLLSRLVRVQVKPVEHSESFLGVPVLNIVIIECRKLYHADDFQ